MNAMKEKGSRGEEYAWRCENGETKRFPLFVAIRDNASNPCVGFPANAFAKRIARDALAIGSSRRIGT